MWIGFGADECGEGSHRQEPSHVEDETEQISDFFERGIHYVVPPTAVHFEAPTSNEERGRIKCIHAY